MGSGQAKQRVVTSRHTEYLNFLAAHHIGQAVTALRRQPGRNVEIMPPRLKLLDAVDDFVKLCRCLGIVRQMPADVGSDHACHDDRQARALDQPFADAVETNLFDPFAAGYLPDARPAPLFDQVARIVHQQETRIACAPIDTNKCGLWSHGPSAIPALPYGRSCPPENQGHSLARPEAHA